MHSSNPFPMIIVFLAVVFLSQNLLLAQFNEGDPEIDPDTDASVDFVTEGSDPPIIGDRIWISHSSAWDKLNKIRFKITGGTPGAKYQVSFRHAKVFATGTENNTTPTVTGWSSWKNYRWKQTNILPVSWVTEIEAGDDGGAERTLNVVKIYDPNGFQPPVEEGEYRDTFYCGHIRYSYYVQLRVIRQAEVIVHNEGQLDQWIEIRPYAPKFTNPKWAFVDPGTRPQPETGGGLLGQ